MRYSVREVFDTFPWPRSPDERHVGAVAAASREVRRVRKRILDEQGGGLRDLYRLLDLPGRHPLRDAHDALDAAVNTAYGFDGRKPLLGQILALNRAVAESERVGQTVSAPGLPDGMAAGDGLVSQDCYAE